MNLEIDHLLHLTHNLFEVPVRGADTVFRSSVPGSDRLFDAVLRVMIRLDQEKHLLGFLDAVSVSHCVALLTVPLFEDDVAILDENRGNLHDADGVATLCVGISSTFNLDDCIHDWIPVDR